MKITNLLAGTLLSLSTLLFTNCTADRDFVSTPREILSEGSWSISSLYASGDKTGLYAGHSFSFGTNGTVTVSSHGESVSGTWRWIKYANSEVLQLQLPGAAGLQELQGPWTLQEWNRRAMTLKAEGASLSLARQPLP
jgi:hypothetical protein